MCSDEDDTAELLKELQRIKRERAEVQAQKVCCLSVYNESGGGENSYRKLAEREPTFECQDQL